MRTKIIAVLLAVLTALGGLNLFQSIKKRLMPTEQATVEVQEETKQHRYTISAAEIKHEEADKVEVRVAVSERIADSEVMIDESFDVSEGDNLEVDITHSDVNIRTGNSSEARVRVTLDGRNMGRARTVFEEMNFRVYQEGDRVVLRADDHRRNWNFRNTGGAEIHVEIDIPRSFNVDMQTTHGDIVMDDLNGIMNVNTSHGDIEAGTLRGERIEIQTSHGDIDAAGFGGRDIVLRTSHAEIEIGIVESERFEAKTSHSDVEIDYVSGDTEISTSHGDIRVNLTGDAEARFTTSHGDVDVGTDPAIAAELDLKGARVRVSSDYQLAGTVKKDRVEGSLNGGGPRIIARTTHGTVTMRPRSR